MKRTKFLVATALVATLAMVGSAHAQGDFSPEMTFDLSDTKVKGNPAMTITVAQDNGEEELASVMLKVPKGFNIPSDEAVPDGDELGTGEIVIHAGPGCRPGGPADADIPLTLPATLVEADRTDDQLDSGVYAVWVLDISGVTTVPLVVTGSKGTGFTFQGDIAPNDNTCPPFEFSLTINSASASGVKLLTNPKKAGKKAFLGSLTSADSPTTVNFKTVFKITK